MDIRFATLAAALVLVCGCAQYRKYPAPNDLDIGQPQADMTSSGSSTGGQEASGGPRGRTREEVHKEAVEAVRNHKSTLNQELEWFNPYAH
jgi:hypothetical protein